VGSLFPGAANSGARESKEGMIMECPFCRKIDNEVIDSRLAKEGTAIRRRRRCVVCAGRFTTFESTPEHLPYFWLKKQVGHSASRKNLQTVLGVASKAFRGLFGEIEKLVDEVAKEEKRMVAQKTKKKVMAKAKRKKKAVPSRKVILRKASKMTDTAKVLKIVKSQKNGVNIAVLKSKTGFDDAKVRSIIYRAYKEGKIKRIDRGVYTTA
jgi:transcriptional repressor NrdR